MRASLFLLAAALLIPAPLSSAHADTPRSKAKHTWHKPRPQPDRDCVPINGRFGYYGNPWCDTGSLRPPDIEFREHQRVRAR